SSCECSLRVMVASYTRMCRGHHLSRTVSSRGRWWPMLHRPSPRLDLSDLRWALLQSPAMTSIERSPEVELPTSRGTEEDRLHPLEVSLCPRGDDACVSLRDPCRVSSQQIFPEDTRNDRRGLSIIALCL